MPVFFIALKISAKNISGEQNFSILIPEHKKKFKKWRKKYAEEICTG